MKKTFTLISLLAAMYANGQVAFPSANAVWTQRHGAGEAPPTFSFIGMKTADIVIGGVTYHKLYKSVNDNVLEESEYIGGIREAAGGKIYYYNAATSSEKLIYDFSIAVGDTVADPATDMKVGVVHSTDYVTIGGVSRKRIIFRQLTASTPWSSSYWIEGIGNSGTGGLLSFPMAQPTCDCGINTVCLSENSTTEYQNPGYMSVNCESAVSTSNLDKAAAAVTLSPNPVTATSHLVIPAGGKYKTVEIFNIIGKKTYTAALNGAADIAISKDSFAPGVYLYQLQGENGATAGKFVVE